MKFLWLFLSLLLEKIYVSMWGVLSPSLFAFSVDTVIDSDYYTYFVYQVYSGTAGDDWGQIDFSKTTEKVTVIADDDMLVRFSYDDTGYEDVIEISTTLPYDIDIQAKHAKVKNATFGDSVSFQILAFYLST